MRKSWKLMMCCAIYGMTSGVMAMDAPNQTKGFLPATGFQNSRFDHVNLFNGALTLTLPIGQRYTVGAGLSYGLQLTYNSNLWTYEQRLDGEEYVTAASADKMANAGIGWLLTLGELLDGRDMDDGRWVYISPDGARHTFYDAPINNQDDGDPDVFFTRDGSFLRMSRVNGGTSQKLVESPDGRQHTFLKVAGGWRLLRIEDRFGNSLTLSVVTSDDAQTWTLSDSQGRTHYVELTEMLWIGKQVTRVDLEAFDGQRAQYDFSYSSIMVNRSCKDTDPETDKRTRLPHLVRVDLPDGSYYEMKDGGSPNYYNICTVGQDAPGVLKGMRLPTGGQIEWVFGEHEFPPKQDDFDSSVGVTERILYDGHGAEIGAWTYLRRNFTGPDNEKDLRTHVVPPSGECTKHYFAQQYWLSVQEQSGWEYGLPFSLAESDGAGLPLSTELWSSASADGSCSGTVLRSTYRSFTHDRLPGSASDENRPRWLDTNRRAEAARTVFHDDGDRYVEARFSDFDGYGHYRTVTTSGNFWDESAHSEERVTTTHYNLDEAAGLLTHGGDRQGVIPISEPWVLGIYDYQEITEDDAFGESVSRVETTFDRATGFLECRRVLTSGTERGADDLLVVFTPDSAGNRALVEDFGGDLQALGLAAGCAAGTTPESVTEQSWAYGSRSRVQRLESDHEPLPFLSWDADIDAGTGRVKTVRDRSGLATNFSYDTMGRLLERTPEEGATTVYSYVAAIDSLPAVIHVASHSQAGASVLAESEIVFDDLGRVVQRRQLQPGNGWVESAAVYDAQDRVLSLSAPGFPDKRTEYLEYDAFGRPGTVRPPEGAAHDIQFTYFGAREVIMTTSVATSAGAEEWVPRERHLDIYGRLRRVVEASGPDGVEVPTTYSYDVGHRLTRIFTDVPDSDQDQSRYYSYDSRGFLLSEQHPEKGAGGNGLVFYSDYDGRGRVGRLQDGPNELTYSYDAAGRPTAVRNALADDRLVKEYLYDSAPGRGNGRPWKAIRHNWVDLPWTSGGEEDVTVTEELSYSGLGGRISDRSTTSSLNGYGFQQGFTWNELGQLAQVHYPQCLHADCPSDTPEFNLDFEHDLGFLTQVGDLTGTMTYHPSGMVATVPHANGVTDRIDVDPAAPMRPLQIYSTGTVGGGDWNSGALAFDGSGNIKTQFDDLPIVYDRVNRLVEMNSPQGRSQSYHYDTFGNITAITTQVGQNSETRSATVVSTTNRLSSAAYDEAGNMTSWAGGGTYSYDELSRLQQQNGGEWTYLYNASGERTVAIHYTGDVGSRTEIFSLRDLSGKVLREWRLTGDSAPGQLTWLHDYSYRGSALLAKFDAEDGTIHFHPNHLGTPILQTDGAGGRRLFHWYHAYGEEATAANGDDESIRFTGHQMDVHGLSSTDDLYYAHARYLSPHLARFLTVDQLRGLSSVPQSLNRYAYAWGRPSVFVDLDGKNPGVAIAVVAGAAVAIGMTGGVIAMLGNNMDDRRVGAVMELVGTTLIFTGSLGAGGPVGASFAAIAVGNGVATVEELIDLRDDPDSPPGQPEDADSLDSPELPDTPPADPAPEDPVPDVPMPEAPPEFDDLPIGAGSGMSIFNMTIEGGGGSGGGGGRGQGSTEVTSSGVWCLQQNPTICGAL